MKKKSQKAKKQNIGAELMEALRDAIAHEKGKRPGLRVTVLNQPSKKRH